jgi:hypothetical protein
MSTSSKIAENLLEPLIVGGIATAAIKFMYPGSRTIKVLDAFPLPDYLAIGLAVGASSAVSETLKLWVLPYLPNNKSFASLEGMLLGPALAGATSIVAMVALTDSKPASYLNSFLIGAGSDLAGKYLYQFAKSAKKAL